MILFIVFILVVVSVLILQDDSLFQATPSNTQMFFQDSRSYNTLANVTHICFFDISIDEIPKGRIEIGLFGNVVPITTRNFKELCQGTNGLSPITGYNLTYNNTFFHKIYPGAYTEAGDIHFMRGEGGESIYGFSFPDENFKILHNVPYLVAMAAKQANNNTSTFYITFSPLHHMDYRHVIFGQVIDGFETLKAIELVGSPDGYPRGQVKITNSGEL